MVTLRALREPFERYPLAREAMIAVAVVGSFAIWVELVGGFGTRVATRVGFPSFENTLLEFVVHAGTVGTFTVLSMVAFAGAYVYLRNLDLHLGGVDRTALRWAGGAVLAGGALIVAVKLTAFATGTTMSAITGTFVAADAAVGPVLVLTALGLFVRLLAYLFVTHVFVQRSLERATGGALVVVLTTLIVWAFGPTTLPSADLPHSALVTVLVVSIIALPAVAATLFERRWLTALTAVPLVILVAGIAVERITDLQTVADVAYGIGEIAIVALGVAAYQRTESLLPSALAFGAFVVGAEVIVLAFEAGIGP